MYNKGHQDTSKSVPDYVILYAMLPISHFYSSITQNRFCVVHMKLPGTIEGIMFLYS